MHMIPIIILLLEGRRVCQFPNSNDLILRHNKKSKDRKEKIGTVGKPETHILFYLA